MDTRRPPLAGSEHHHHQHYQQRPPPPPPPPGPGPGPGPAHGPGPAPPYTTRPQSLPSVDSFHAPPPLTAPPHQYGPPPPTLLHPTPHSEAQERPEHAYTAPPAVHSTPIIKTDVPPSFQRPPSTPSQPQPHPQPVPSTAGRPPHMEHQPPGYPPPHPSAPGEHHVAYMAGPPIMEHYGPPPPGFHPGYMYSGLHMANANPRKKSMRASQACDKCRERKSKCDEQRPCSTCKDQNIECHYKDNQPTKTDKSNAAMSDQIERLATLVEVMSERIERMEKHQLDVSNHRVDTPNTSPPDRYQSDSRRESVEEHFNLGEHTTAAHKLLLLWPSIHPFIRNGKLDIKDNYVMKGEDRGILRLYGIGERSLDDRVAIGAASPAPSHNSDEFSASPPDGPTNGFTSWDNEPRRSEPFAHDSVMLMDAETLDRLFDNYKRRIHRLHPFLDMNSLGRYLKSFKHKHCLELKHPHSPMFATGPGERDHKRRKRSDGFPVGIISSETTSYSSQPQRRQPERTVINAIIYLVFALGRVCEATDPLPGPVQEVISQTSKPSSYPYANSPITRPSPSSPRSFNMNPSTSEAYRTGVRAASWDGSPAFDNNNNRKQAHNVDKIPGLAYYREACSILGDFSDSNELACAQARLLAGLYKGQLARVQESWSWIHSAARTCLYRLKIDGLDRQFDYGHEFDKNENLTLLAYWTCLQLESDILAEWDYPSSGLSALENLISWPTNVIDEEATQKMTTDLGSINIYYSAQLFLRRRLNQIHAKLYGTDLSTLSSKALSKSLLEHDNTLQSWRSLPNPMTFWKDEDAPASDILAARLRAKYYGARYVATRPFLDYALHVMHEVERGQTLEKVTKDAQGRQRENELALFKAMYDEMGSDDIKEKCKVCIESAMQSTVAFDVVAQTQRLIVTNIMGTAHAQFGNMLVLAATYNSGIDWLKRLVPREKLQPLLRRTIKFIRKLQHASHTAQIDVMILEAVEKTLFPAREDNNIYENEHHTGDSFTST